MSANKLFAESLEYYECFAKANKDVMISKTIFTKNI